MDDTTMKINFTQYRVANVKVKWNSIQIIPMSGDPLNK